jgi:predicted unusual protein kinase regulating ubiquinone biosynthesis (AarF/ABC1/UbiB family)
VKKPVSKFAFQVHNLQRYSEALATATIAQVHVAHLNDPNRTKVAVKVQNPESEALMAMDMANMLQVAETMDKLELHLPFDHTSILRGGAVQVAFS